MRPHEGDKYRMPFKRFALLSVLVFDHTMNEYLYISMLNVEPLAKSFLYVVLLDSLLCSFSHSLFIPFHFTSIHAVSCRLARRLLKHVEHETHIFYRLHISNFTVQKFVRSLFHFNLISIAFCIKITFISMSLFNLFSDLQFVE